MAVDSGRPPLPAAATPATASVITRAVMSVARRVPIPPPLPGLRRAWLVFGNLYPPGRPMHPAQTSEPDDPRAIRRRSGPTLALRRRPRRHVAHPLRAGGVEAQFLISGMGPLSKPML